MNKAVSEAVAVTEYKRKPTANTFTRRKPVIGSNTDSSIKTVPKLGYLHVYRLDPDTNATDLLRCLKKSAPDINFSCSELKSTEQTRPFKVSFPIEYVSNVYDPKIWPKGSVVNRYLFSRDPKNENFQEKASTSRRN